MLPQHRDERQIYGRIHSFTLTLVILVITDLVILRSETLAIGRLHTSHGT